MKKTTKTTLFLSLLLSLGLLVQGCSKKEEKENVIIEKKNQKNTNIFTLQDTNATQYILEKTQNGFKLKNNPSKILILDIFATWCPPCQAEATHLSSLLKKYSQDIVILGVTIEDGIENDKLTMFQKTFHATYPLVNSQENRRIINTIAQQLKLGNNFGIPLLVLYKDGKVINYFQGATEEEFIESDIKRALGKN
jgi:thiol-disulfide isomerase/thioredoxin